MSDGIHWKWNHVHRLEMPLTLISSTGVVFGQVLFDWTFSHYLLESSTAQTIDSCQDC